MNIFSQSITKYKKKIDNLFFYNHIKNYNNFCKSSEKFSDFSNHIIISGEPRGGTTWLMELLMNKSDCLIWEPLHPKQLSIYGNNFDNKIGHMPYIPEEQNWDLGVDYFSNLFKARLPYGLHINAEYDRENLFLLDNLLVKFCRANMLLPWLTKQFPTLKPIYLVRHPLSVISSQYRHPAFKNIGTKDNLFQIRKEQNPLYSDIFEKHEKQINKINSRISMFANWWAIQNILALNHQNKRWLTVSYENLYLNPQKELERISNYLGVSVNRFSVENINKPSSTTKSGSGILEKRDQLANFSRFLNKDEIKETMEIINSYGITCYNEELEPDYKKLGYDSI